jgi:hypothetical protein
MADKLAKEATSKTELPISYNRVPKSAIKRDIEGLGIEEWQREWENTDKGSVTKEYFPKVQERLHRNLNPKQNSQP